MMPKGPIQHWAERIGWDQRVRAVCKPCWELKYCPYGPLVEQYPLRKKRTAQSCRIFGHDCPVFYSAEPFTETRELRRISRHIPRDIQFKVLKRDNQICQICNNPVRETDIAFDHIIPFSKGGPTEEHNIRLVCSSCNSKRRAEFEKGYLVANFGELVFEPLAIDFTKAILGALWFYHDYMREHSKEPTLHEYNHQFTETARGGSADIVQNTVGKLKSMLGKDAPEFFRGTFDAFRFRYGFTDGRIHKAKQISDKFHVDLKLLFEVEMNILSSVGFNLKQDNKSYQKWTGY
jgi:hypothetical protein